MAVEEYPSPDAARLFKTKNRSMRSDSVFTGTVSFYLLFVIFPVLPTFVLGGELFLGGENLEEPDEEDLSPDTELVLSPPDLVMVTLLPDDGRSDFPEVEDDSFFVMLPPDPMEDPGACELPDDKGLSLRLMIEPLPCVVIGGVCFFSCSVGFR
jgi:hypothetical protein